MTSKIFSRSGAWELLNTLTASNSATLSDTTSFTSAFNEYEIVIQNLVPATTSVALELQVHSGGSFQTTSYIAQEMHASSTSVLANPQTTYIPLNGSAQLNSAPGLSGNYRVQNPSQTSSPKVFNGLFWYTATGPAGVTGNAGGYWNGGNGAIDGFQILFSSGNITSGTVKVYGRM